MFLTETYLESSSQATTLLKMQVILTLTLYLSELEVLKTHLCPHWYPPLVELITVLGIRWWVTYSPRTMDALEEVAVYLASSALTSTRLSQVLTTGIRFLPFLNRYGVNYNRSITQLMLSSFNQWVITKLHIMLIKTLICSLIMYFQKTMPLQPKV